MTAPTYPGREAFTGARRTDPSTSHVAAAMVGAKVQRERIMELMREPLRNNNWTADELDEYIGWRVTTAGRRLSELHTLKLIEPCGERLTRSGRPAKVYRIKVCGEVCGS